MSKVRRIYVEKKADYAVKAEELKAQIKDYLGIKTKGVRVLVRYDMEGVSDETYNKAKVTVFSEPPIDDVYEETFPIGADEKCFSQEYLPGQLDQRADSAEKARDEAENVRDQAEKARMIAEEEKIKAQKETAEALKRVAELEALLQCKPTETK